LRVIGALGWHTFLEAVRDRILYLLVFFGIFVFGLSRLLSPLALGEGRRITIDVGLVSLSAFGCLLTIFVGHQLIFREIERKTLYFLFSRPIRRADFVVGKYLGLLMVLAVCLTAMGSILAGVLVLSKYAFGWAFLQAIFMTFLELSIVAALAILLASFTTPVLAGLLTLAAYLIGHGSGDLLTFLQGNETSTTRIFERIFAVLVPRLDLYNDSLPVLTGMLWSPEQCLYGALYAVCYAGACLFFATVVLSRRELAL